MATPIFLQRLELLLGPETIERLNAANVAVFGLGGVGSWCAEALARNGVGNLTLVDSDVVCTTNINRQIQATHKTVGSSKVKLLAERMSEINPALRVNAIHDTYDRNSRRKFEPSNFDYVIDAIDSLGNKVDLIEDVLRSETTLFSALGASCKIDPTAIKVGSFWEVIGCPLGKHLRKRVRNRGLEKDFLCVFSNENIPNCLLEMPRDSDDPPSELDEKKKQINGSSVHVTATFGMFLAGLVVKDIYKKSIP